MTTENTTTETVAAAELRSFIERIENVRENIEEYKGDEKDIMAELKSRGYDGKAVRKILALRKMDPNERLEEESILDAYKAALGME